MKKIVIASLALATLLSFTTKLEPKFDVKKIIGSWQLNEFYFNGKTKLDLDLYADCEKKETIKFNDSIVKNVTFTSFGPKCFKAINSCNYKIESSYNREKEDWEYRINTACKAFPKNMIIIELNDSILKIGQRNNQYETTFNAIKTYKKRTSTH